MDLYAIAAVASAALAAFIGLLSRRISTAPGSADQGRFPAVALSAAAYAACNFLTATAAPHALVPLLSRLQTASAMVHLWSWFHYSRAFLGIRAGRAERVASLALLAAAAAALVPEVAIYAHPVEAADSPFGFAYVGAEPTRLGMLLLGAGAAGSLPVLYRFVRAWRSGVAYGGIHAGAFGALVLLGASDALVGTGAVPGPYLLHVGFALPVLAIGWVITERFIESTRALDGMRRRLVADVDARSRELASTRDALHQAEKLAALGQFANGVAHEVNNPAAVVTTNLRYLDEARRAGALPDDAPEAVADALESMKRINDLVRKLVDAGRIAAISGPAGAVSVAEIAARVAAERRRDLAPAIALSVNVPDGFLVHARPESLERALANLLANAGEAIPRGRAGRIELGAERAGDAVRITVRDDGTGMAPEVLRRAQDPFFTTKDTGRGAGLGLPVARGLVEAHGGTLSLESTPGRGTVALVELPAAAAPREPAPPREP